MPYIGPNTALAISFSGLLGIYLECLRPGTIIAGCVGVAFLLWGAYTLYTFGPSGRGCLFLLLAAVLFAIEIWRNTRFLSAIAGTAALFLGLKELLVPPHQIQVGFALSLSVVLGVITAFLCTSAREARRNKWADLPSR